MKKENQVLIAALVFGLSAVCPPLQAQPSAKLQTARLLSEAREPVRIVCFGDSITGVYYHSGNRRAWPEMLNVALSRLYPKAELTVINAGRSGHTTAQGLERMQKDVLAHAPHLVVVMFGMNDLAYGAGAPEKNAARDAAFVGRLKAIAGNCRAAKAEVILCTQNPVYPEALPRRPPERVGEYAGLIRQTGAELKVPVVDIYAEWNALRASDPHAWRLLMSETIHPSMAGHKRMAERVAGMISGRTVSLADVYAEQPVCARLIRRLKGGNPVTLVAPAPLAACARVMVLRRFPSANVTVVSLPEKIASLDVFDEKFKGIRDRNPDLVLVSLTPAVLTVGNEEAFVRQVSWMVNGALPFAGSAWTAVGVDPALADPDLTRPQREGAELLREIVRGHDLDWIGQSSGPPTALQDAFNQWFDRQAEAGR